jgi:hypothetical protein
VELKVKISELEVMKGHSLTIQKIHQFLEAIMSKKVGIFLFYFIF